MGVGVRQALRDLLRRLRDAGADPEAQWAVVPALRGRHPKEWMSSFVGYPRHNGGGSSRSGGRRAVTPPGQALAPRIPFAPGISLGPRITLAPGIALTPRISLRPGIR